jgi:hypothetical protein
LRNALPNLAAGWPALELWFRKSSSFEQSTRAARSSLQNSPRCLDLRRYWKLERKQQSPKLGAFAAAKQSFTVLRHSPRRVFHSVPVS